jgi:hypothetical protein
MLAGLGSAQAQIKPATAPNLSGTFRAGTTSIKVAVESWGGDCGPRPQDSSSGGGGLVTVVHEGKSLAIQGRDGDIRSDTCWSRNPSMRKQTSALLENVWTTRCKTAANDPREEQGTYVLKALGPDTLQYQDTSHYNWALNTSKCVATFTTTQTLTRVLDSKVAPVATAPPPSVAPTTEAAAQPEPASTCKPGLPSRLTLRPKHADIDVGGRVCVRARVTDAADCVVPDAKVAWQLKHSKALRGELVDGCFTAASSTAEAEGEFTIIASLLDLRADASVSVHSVDLSALIAKRMEGDGVQGFAEAAAVAAPAPKAAARIATRSVAEPPAPKQRRAIWIAGAGAVLLLALGAVVLARRKRVAEAPEPSMPPAAAPVRARASPVPAPAAAPRPAAAAPVAPSPASERPVAREPWICPLCRVGYPAERGTCPRDGATLMPYAEFNQRTRSDADTKQKRCPKCGDMFPATSAFCGKDGASLVDA